MCGGGGGAKGAEGKGEGQGGGGCLFFSSGRREGDVLHRVGVVNAGMI